MNFKPQMNADKHRYKPVGIEILEIQICVYLCSSVAKKYYAQR